MNTVNTTETTRPTPEHERLRGVLPWNVADLPDEDIDRLVDEFVKDALANGARDVVIESWEASTVGAVIPEQFGDATDQPCLLVHGWAVPPAVAAS